jgi:transposase InsO family protein
MTSNPTKEMSHVAKFDGTNFQFWKFQITLLLEQHDLIEIVTGVSTAPIPDIDASTQAVKNSAVIKTWNQRDSTARNFIVFTMESQQARSMMTCKSAKEMWTRLTDQYEQVASENKHFLRQRFYQYEFNKEHDIAAHITMIESMANQLNDMGVSVDEIDIVTKIIVTLPPSYKHIVSVWDNMDDSKKTLQSLRSRLFKEEARNKGCQEEDGANAAFFAKKQEMSNQQSTQPAAAHIPSQPPAQHSSGRGRGFRKRRCNYCGGPNHWESTCWTKKDHMERGVPNGFQPLQAQFAQFKPQRQPDWPGDYAFTTLPGDIQFEGNFRDNWYVDSGCTIHMSDQFHLFSNYQAVKNGSWPVKGVGCSNNLLQAKGMGDITIQTNVNEEWHSGILKNVLFVPDLGVNLFSVRSATKAGLRVLFNNDRVTISKGEKIVAVGESFSNHLYRLNIRSVKNHHSKVGQNSDGQQTAFHALSRPEAQPLHLWHHRLGHTNTETIRKMESEKLVDGLVIKRSDTSAGPFCEGCALGKHHRLPFPTGGRKRANRIGELIHSDVCGPMSRPSPKGAKYFVIFKDDFSGYVFIYFIKLKSEVEALFRQLVQRILVETGQHVATLRSDNGGEYFSNKFEEWLKENGIKHESSAPKTPEQNGVSERSNRTIVEPARSMLHAAGLPIELWAEASNTAVYIKNRVVSRSREGKTPYELWKGIKPNFSHLRVFGADAYVHVPKDERTKFDPKAIKCIHVGYCETQKAFRLWDPATRKVRISRDVLFNEERFCSISRESCFSNPPLVYPEELVPENSILSPSEDPPETLPSENQLPLNPDQSSEAQEAPTVTIDPAATNPRKKKQVTIITPREENPLGARIRNKPSRWIEESQTEKYAGMALLDVEEPETVEEALNSAESEKWMLAMDEEYQSLMKNNTWTLCRLPVGRNAIRNKWVYTIKSGTEVRYKARLVAKGFTQRPGIDYEETYSPVVRHDSLRAVLAITAAENLEMAQLDVKTAFLNGDLHEELYMFQPTGFEIEGQEDLVCRLNKSLYGLKQASRSWNEKFNNFLVQYGFSQSKADPCVYTIKTETELTIMAIWVDDGIVCSSLQSRLEDIVRYLENVFEMTHGDVECFVGIQIRRNPERNLIHISQEKYIEKILEKFQMENCYPKTVPADPHARLSNNAERDPKDSFPFREAVGSLMFAATCTRPDIAFAVNQVAQFSTNPAKAHWEAVKRILSYLRGTITSGICYGGVQERNMLLTYSDSDYAGDLVTRKSTTGVFCFLNGGPVSWSSHRQDCVSLSSTEAEYVAASAATKTVIWFRQLLDDIGWEQKSPTTLLCDNQGAISLVKNSGHQARTKHIDVKYHHIRNMVKEGVIHIQYIHTSQQLADILTKPLDGQLFSRLREESNIVDINHVM